MSDNLKRQEDRIRRLAAREGYRLVKSRARNLHINNLGEYMLVDNATNGVVMGASFDASLAKVLDFLDSYLQAEANQPLVGEQCLKLLGMKDHPLAHTRLGDATQDEVMAAAKLHERAGAEAAKREAALRKLS